VIGVVLLTYSVVSALHEFRNMSSLESNESSTDDCLPIVLSIMLGLF